MACIEEEACVQWCKHCASYESGSTWWHVSRKRHVSNGASTVHQMSQGVPGAMYRGRGMCPMVQALDRPPPSSEGKRSSVWVWRLHVMNTIWQGLPNLQLLSLLVPKATRGLGIVGKVGTPFLGTDLLNWQQTQHACMRVHTPVCVHM